MLDTVYVCDHALDRWRERASIYVDSPQEEVIEVLRKSRKINLDDFLPIPRQPGTHYYHHKDHDAYFVVEPIDRTSCRIVTVIIPGQTQAPILTPKKKVKKPKPVEVTQPVGQPANGNGERVHVTPALASPAALKTLEEVMLRVVPEEKSVSAGNEAAHEYRKLVNMMHEIERRIGGMTRNQPLRKQLAIQLRQIQNRMAVLKPEYRKYINDLAARENDQPIRSDGSVNYVAAILLLLKRTEQQQKEIEELKNAVAFLLAS